MIDLKNRQWFNTQPLEKNDLRDKVVIFFFLKKTDSKKIKFADALWKRYKNHGLSVVTVFSEKRYGPVLKKIDELDIRSPVIFDSDRKLTNFFSPEWPSCYLFDHDLKNIYSGKINDIEKKTRELMIKYGKIPEVKGL